MTRLGVFAKYWEPGQVKTRLGRRVGMREASELYRAGLNVLLRRLSKSADSCCLLYWPRERRQAFAALAGPGWELAPQSPGDLGARMQHYFELANQLGGAAAVLIGSDSPTIPLPYVNEAFRLLEDCSLVLGPAEDGGYYLIGVRGDPPPIFADVPWSSSQVWKHTLQLVEQAGIAWKSLPPWYDLDEWPDLLRLKDELAQFPSNDETWLELQNAVKIALRREA